MARKNAIERMVSIIRRILIAISFVALLGAILKIGFQLHPEDIRLLEIFYPILLALVMACQLFLLWAERRRRKVGRVALVGWLLLLVSALSMLAFTLRPPGPVFDILHADFFPALFFLGMLTYELSMLQIGWWSAGVRPPTLFIGSFLFLILTGTLLLLLPRATREGITLIDALFTSTSAVCVTGLVVLDTGRDFTIFGQWVILSLIQLGGLGMMTFTSFFAFFFRGDSSFGNRLMLHNLTQTTNLNNVFGVLSRILLVTFFVEAVGAMLIFREVPMAGPLGERARFAIFHAVSAFCNAGFSTLGDSLYASGFRDNYSLHMIIAVLLIIGGLGFPIVFNLMRYFRFHAALIWARFLNRTHKAQKPNLMTLNSRIVLATTALLLVVGTMLIYIAEQNGVLEGETLSQRLVTAFFAAATPRTAGFNTVDMTALALPTILITMGLMWIGASPGSTGGGIKTSTFALALLNIRSVARSSEHVEFRYRRIDPESLHRAFGVIVLSLIGIAISIFLLGLVEPQKDFLAIIFECISAYSTVGLTLGITPELSTAGKIIITITMFVGRVGAITLVIALFQQVRFRAYAYPSERILIN